MMRFYFLSLLCVIFSWPIALPGENAVGAAAPGVNLIANSSFEEVDANGFPLGWGCHLPVVPTENPLNLQPGLVSMFSTDTGTFKSGSRSLKISSDSPVRCSIAQQIPFKTGQKLRLSAWMKGENLDFSENQGAWIRLGFINDDPTIANALAKQQGFLKSTNGTFDWTFFTTDVVVPENVQSMPLECYLYRSKGTVWFDDVSIEVVEGPASIPVKDPANKGRYAAANATLPPAGTPSKRVIFIGDSITDNWKLDTSFPNEGFINRGIGGQTTSQIYARFHEDALALNPKVIYLLAGTNDLAGGVTPENIVNNIRGMVRQGNAQGCKMIVCSLTPTSDYHKDKDPNFARTVKRPLDKIIETNRQLAAMCSAEKATYLDLFTLLVDTAGFMTSELSNDGLHPNAAGYAAIAPTVLRTVQAARDN